MNKRIQSLILLSLTALVLFSGCATILGKSAYPVAIRTDPKGADISITNKKNKEVYKGTGPATVLLKCGAGYFSKARYQVKISAPGFGEQIIPLNYKLNAWYFGNLLIGGALRMLIVDPLTGAMWKLVSPPIDVILTKTEASVIIPLLRITSIGDVPDSLMAGLVKIK